MKYIRKMVSYLLVIVLVFSSVPVQEAQASEIPNTKAHAYYMIDADTGEKILSKNANKMIYPASTVKLMTALVALDHAKDTLKITYTNKLSKMIPSDAAALNLRTGRTYTVNQYLHMLLLVSDAAAATALAVGIAGSMDRFVEWMNEKADALGMDDTSFDNPIGLDKGSGYPDTYTTAADFIKVSKASMENQTIRSIVVKRKYKVSPIEVSKSFTIKNTNAFYSTYKNMVKDAGYEIIGSKTGTTRAAGHALVATARDSEGHEVICAFYGKGTHKRLYKDVKKLFDYAFEQYEE